MKLTCTETNPAAMAWTSAPATLRVASILVDPYSAAFQGTRVPTGPQTIPATTAVDAVPSMQVVTGGVPPRGAPR